jgi:hypothetical protein
LVTVLQLDTEFPRPPGDVGCAATYTCDLEIIRIRNATVSAIVTNKPETINVGPFEQAIQRAKGDLIVTSCGFLSYWQHHLSALINKPFISSALTALDHLSHQYAPSEVLIVTFDAASLTAAHLGRHRAYASGIVGLPKDMHLREVISQNLQSLDVARASREIAAFTADQVRPHHRHILLECTNLPPYKSAIVRATGLPMSDILTQIDRALPDSIVPLFIG